MVSILKVPGMMSKQSVVPTCPNQSGEVTADSSRVVEVSTPPPSPTAGSLAGAGEFFGTDCTGWVAGNPPSEDDAGFDMADVDVDQPDDADDRPDTIEVDVDGDGEADLEVTDEADIPEDGVIIEDGDTPDVDEDGEADVDEDGDVADVDEDGDTIPDGEDGETAGPCDHAPFVDPIPAYPSIGALDVELNPTLNGADAVDVDPGDEIASYNFIVSANPDLSSPIINVTDLPISEYPVPAGVLADATTYYWAMEAVDTCGLVTRSVVWNFTTLRTCLPYSFTETDFTSGALSGGAVAVAGTLRLAEDSTAWTGRYEGDVLPEAAGWTPVGSAGSATPSSGELIINTLGSNGFRYFDINPTFDNAVGSVVEIRSSVDGSDEGGMLYLSLADGRRSLDFNIYANQIIETNSGLNYFFPAPGPGMHTFRVEFAGNDFRVFMDGSLTPIIDGAGRSLSPAGGANYVRFGDPTDNPDINTRVDYLYFYNLGDKIPYLSPGSYESIPEDTGMIDNDLGGSTINWTPLSAPGAVSVSVRAGNSPDLSALPWSAEITDNPANLPPLYGQYLQWRMTINAVTSTTTPVIDEANGGTVCP